MRPLRLMMQAFGPYVAAQTIDFTHLGERQFFLVHGPVRARRRFSTRFVLRFTVKPAANVMRVICAVRMHRHRYRHGWNLILHSAIPAIVLCVSRRNA